MLGTLAGALAGRKIPFDRSQLSATVDGRIASYGRTIRIESIVVHYDLTLPAEHRETVERSLRVHVAGCPAYQSLKAAISISWDATLRLDADVVEIAEAVPAG
jgi:hypothetical protein